jgi:hypothetical protein
MPSLREYLAKNRTSQSTKSAFFMLALLAESGAKFKALLLTGSAVWTLGLITFAQQKLILKVGRSYEKTLFSLGR